MKFTYIVRTFPNLSETFILNQITGLIDRGYNIDIISLNKPKNDIHHEKVYEYDLFKKTQYISWTRSQLGFEFNDRLLSSLFLTDIIHSHFASWPTEFALNLFEKFNIPFLFTAHAYDIFVNPDIFTLQKKINSALKVITISDYNKDYLTNLFGKDLSNKINVIRCGVELSKFKYLERHEKKFIKILFVGRLVEKKGCYYAIEAFKKALKKNNNLELSIIGDGYLKEDIHHLINASDLKSKISMLGPQTQQNVLKEMERADIFFLPSLTAANGDREGIPISILEAQAMGLPVISTYHSGIPEVINNGENGFLVPERDVDAMAEKLILLASQHELRNRMGEIGRNKIKHFYNHEIELDNLENIFNKLLKNSPLLSGIEQTHGDAIKQRLDKIAAHIRELDNNILKKDKEIKQKDGQINYLQNRLKSIQNTISYKIYYLFIRNIFNFIKLLFRYIKLSILLFLSIFPIIILLFLFSIYYLSGHLKYLIRD